MAAKFGFSGVLTQLPSAAYLLRALGLGIVSTLVSKWRTPEAPKAVLRRSAWIALSRCAIHVFPVGVLAVLIYFNYRIYYIGPDLTQSGAATDAAWLAAIQVAAKIEELCCVASLTAIVLQALRRELLSDGVPIGLLGAGTWFSSISSFWSPDFLAAAPWSMSWVMQRDSAGMGRTQLYVLIIVAGAVAATIGPASAILMLPRNQSVPAGSTSYYLNGTAEMFWPNTVDSSLEIAACGFVNATSYATCPSGGYASMSQLLSTFNYSTFYNDYGNAFAPLTQAEGPSANRQFATLLVQSPQSLVPPVLASQRVEYGGTLRTVATQPHAASVILLQHLVEQWNIAAAAPDLPLWSRYYTQSYELTAIGNIVTPLVRTACTDAQNLSVDATEALFPFLSRSGSSSYWATEFMNISITSADRNESSSIRTQWLPSSEDDEGNVATDVPTSHLLIEFPWSNQSRVALGCSIAASWWPATVSSDRAVDYDAWVISTDALSDAVIANLTNPVTLDESWLRLLTPAVQGAPESPTLNSLEQIFNITGYGYAVSDLRENPQYSWNGHTCVWESHSNSNLTDTELWNDVACQQGNRHIFAEFVVAMVVADGLSRYGSALMYDVHPFLGDWSLRVPLTFNSTRLLAHQLYPASSDLDQVAQWLSLDVVGFAFYANTATDYLALTVAGIYILLAATHVLWTLWPAHLVTSSAWESVTELLVLCYNSPPAAPSSFKNASAGIERLTTYAKVVRVSVVPKPNAPEATTEGPEARLVLCDEGGSCRKRVDTGTARLDVVVIDKKYS